ncbi:hypothetical protein JXA32_10275 [Candidatus Sumerlaeota bacterium]|nr:hypothetical protein [Candidatus Sumerlaeota bacterium]
MKKHALFCIIAIIVVVLFSCRRQHNRRQDEIRRNNASREAARNENRPTQQSRRSNKQYNNPDNALEILAGESTAILEALKQYHEIHGVYPNSLEDLNQDFDPPSAGDEEWRYNNTGDGQDFRLYVNMMPQYEGYENWCYQSVDPGWHADKD